MKNFRYIDGVAILRLNRETCIGCGICVTVCPHRLFAIEEKKARIIDPDACMECGACATNCPVEAIYVNPDDGCGCASLLINRWISRVTGRTVTKCAC